MTLDPSRPDSASPLASPAPRVRLVSAFDHPLDNAVAAARTCYSPRIITAEEVGATERSRALRDRIARETYAAGHHTTLQHATFQFTFEQVSRQLVWSLFHAHPFYNSEQVSQRYVPVDLSAMTVPRLPSEAMEALFRTAGQRAMEAYARLTDMLMPSAEEAWLQLFPARRAQRDKHLGAIRKKAMEAARYVLPVAAWTHLYHTVSGLTLHRYARALNFCDVPGEARLAIEAMVSSVRAQDPDFFHTLQDPAPLEETPQFCLLASLGQSAPVPSAEQVLSFRREFDASLPQGRCAALIDWSARGEATLADAIRHVLGLPQNALSNEAAIAAVLAPRQNSLLAEPLKLLTMDKLSRCLQLVHYTFRKKLSHTADSQDQRHRMTPAARPVLARQYAAGHPDFVTPALIAACPQAEDFYRSELTALFGAVDRLLDMGASAEGALYLLPNAFPIRFDESGDLLALHHKWTTRLCLTAQEEIWRASRDEVTAVAALHPAITRWIGPPCTLRKAAGQTPFCPEGPRFCGIPAWGRDLTGLQRIL